MRPSALAPIRLIAARSSLVGFSSVPVGGALERVAQLQKPRIASARIIDGTHRLIGLAVVLAIMSKSLLGSRRALCAGLQGRALLSENGVAGLRARRAVGSRCH